MWKELFYKIQDGDIRSLARAISLVENEADGYETLLQMLPQSETKIIGITGPPGAGKSTLTDGLIEELIKQNKKIAVVCVDPSSPFNHGAVLGDRIRLSKWYNNDSVFIRSLATRGSLGGLNSKIIEITDLLKTAPFDFIIVETVGVGQSEIEIAGLADITLLVLVPEAGDDIQAMKAGLMEIADIIAVNKCDRPGADGFVKNLRVMLGPAFRNSHADIPVVKTVASKQEGLHELAEKINELIISAGTNEKKYLLLAEKAHHIIQEKRMNDINKTQLQQMIQEEIKTGDFNMYRFAVKF